MAIPDYQSLMLPVLRMAGDGREHRMSDVVDTLASQLKLTEAEREELLPSGKQPIFNNRVHWAKQYLVKARLLVATRRAFFKITERGQSVLTENVERIDTKFLRRFEEFNAFVAGGRTGVALRSMSRRTQAASSCEVSMQADQLSPKPDQRTRFAWSHHIAVPEKPGCYAILTYAGEVIYVGLATANIRGRMGSHLDNEAKRKGTDLGVPFWFDYLVADSSKVAAIERGWMNQAVLADGEMPALNKVYSPL